MYISVLIRVLKLVSMILGERQFRIQMNIILDRKAGETFIDHF